MNKLSAAFIFFTVFGSNLAGAQNAGITNNELREVVVTAEKVSQSIQKAPISVTVFDQRLLTDMGAQTIADYALSVPALAFQSLGPGEQRILLRGVSDGVDTGLRLDTQNVTGIYIDDMVVSNNETAPDLNLFDVDRVEVLKGPQGTLYGDGSVGGLVRVITKKADPSRTAAAVEATGAAINKGGGDYSLNGMYNMPLSENLALRVVAQYRQRQGFIDDVKRNLDRVNGLKQAGGRASLRWTPTQEFGLTLSFLHQRTQVGGHDDYNQLLGDLKRGTLFSEPKDTRFNLFNAVADLDLDWAHLTSSTSYAVFDRLDASDFTDFLTTAIQSSFGVPDVTLPSHSQQRQRSKDFSQELRLSSRDAGRTTWLGGLYFFKMDEHSFEHDISDGLFGFFNDALGFPLAGTPFDVGPDVAFTGEFEKHRRQFAAFGELSYHFNERLTATFGARWFRDELSERDDAGGIFNGGSVSLKENSSDHNQIFRARLADQITEDALVYVLASQGYRTGGLNPLNPATTNNPNFPQSFDPDKLWNYELGWKTRWLDRRFTLNGAFYYIDWTNEQIELATPGGFAIITNAGKTTIKGVEIDMSWLPMDHLEMGLSGSYIDAELGRDLLDNSDPGNPIVIGRSGDHLVGVPKKQGSLYVQWRMPLSGNVQGVLRSDLQYVGNISRYFSSDQRVPAPPEQFQSYGNYALLNLRAGADWKNFSLMLFAKNVANRRNVLFHGGQGTSTVPTRDDIYVGQPRTIGVTISASF